MFFDSLTEGDAQRRDAIILGREETRVSGKVITQYPEIIWEPSEERVCVCGLRSTVPIVQSSLSLNNELVILQALPL